jgi:hypothetical protein
MRSVRSGSRASARAAFWEPLLTRLSPGKSACRCPRDAALQGRCSPKTYRLACHCCCCSSHRLLYRAITAAAATAAGDIVEATRNRKTRAEALPAANAGIPRCNPQGLTPSSKKPYLSNDGMRTSYAFVWVIPVGVRESNEGYRNTAGQCAFIVDADCAGPPRLIAGQQLRSIAELMEWCMGHTSPVSMRCIVA